MPKGGQDLIDPDRVDEGPASLVALDDGPMIIVLVGLTV
jgi:hypothetical protein